jgi:L-glutamine-phosphate cytidylyltransferase
LFEGRGLTLFDNPRWAETNMVMSLTCAAAWLRAAPCVVSYSDIFYSGTTVASLAAAAHDIAIAYDPNWEKVWTARFADPLGDAETFRRAPDGRVTEIGGRAATITEIEGQYMGLLAFTPSGWSTVETYLNALESTARDKLDMTGLLRRLIAGGTSVMGVPATGTWGEVDNQSDLDLYERWVREGQIALP